MLHRGGGAKYIMKLIRREALRAPRSTGPWARAVFAAAYKAGSESVIATKTHNMRYHFNTVTLSVLLGLQSFIVSVVEINLYRVLSNSFIQLLDTACRNAL